MKGQKKKMVTGSTKKKDVRVQFAQTVEVVAYGTSSSDSAQFSREPLKGSSGSHSSVCQSIFIAAMIAACCLSIAGVVGAIIGRYLACAYLEIHESVPEALLEQLYCRVLG